EDQVDPPGLRQQGVQRHGAPDPEDQEEHHRHGGDEPARAGRHQRLFLNRKKAARPITVVTSDHSSHSQSVSAATAKTRMARKAPQAALTRATRMTAPMPGRPVRGSATHARATAPITAMAMSIYCTGRRPLTAARRFGEESDAILPRGRGISRGSAACEEAASISGRTAGVE